MKICDSGERQQRGWQQPRPCQKRPRDACHGRCQQPCAAHPQAAPWVHDGLSLGAVTSRVMRGTTSLEHRAGISDNRAVQVGVRHARCGGPAPSCTRPSTGVCTYMCLCVCMCAYTIRTSCDQLIERCLEICRVLTFSKCLAMQFIHYFTNIDSEYIDH